MGKTPLPLTILVHSSLWGAPEVRALEEKGHLLASLPLLADSADLILGPNCYRIVPELTKYIDLAVKDAWKVKGRKK